ncbi:MAG: C13 family peptidase [Candidatus Helarchaeota archaeon]
MDKRTALLIILPLISIIIVSITIPVLFITLQDRAPIIQNPTHSDVYAGQSIQINTVVTDDRGVSQVILSYSNNSGSTWIDVTMSHLLSYWIGLIPAQDIETSILYRISARDTGGNLAVNDNGTNYYQLYTGTRKAIIVCSANDFYGSDNDPFGDGNNSHFNESEGSWIANDFGGSCTALWSAAGGRGDGQGHIYIEGNGNTPQGQWIYDWTDSTLVENAYYNLTAWMEVQGSFVGLGGRIGLQWLDSTYQVIRTDWSVNLNSDSGGTWIFLNATGYLDSLNIKYLRLVITLNATSPAVGGNSIKIDDVVLERWIAVNVSNPTDPNPPPNRLNSDGFPAQALQVYWILKSKAYSDDNIFFMLYYENDADGKIDINGTDAIANDLVGAVIDVANSSVNKSRFIRELNVSASGSFASKIDYNDQLIIYMVDHGSNNIADGKNGTFHFEADHSYINETEFYNLVSEINCWRMIINLDSCFSGNFLNQNSSIGSSWYNLTNCLFVSASANVFSWYWINTNNGDQFAGSWFFHQFWDQLSQNKTISQAYNYAMNFIPAGQGKTVAAIQSPLMQDNLDVNTTWSFNSFTRL